MKGPFVNGLAAVPTMDEHSSDSVQRLCESVRSIKKIPVSCVRKISQKSLVKNDAAKLSHLTGQATFMIQQMQNWS